MKKQKTKKVKAAAPIKKTKFFSMDFQKSVGIIARNFIEYDYDAKKEVFECVFNNETDACNFQNRMLEWS